MQGFDSHYDYKKIYRHWHDGSEQFAGADSLLTAIDEGWNPESTLFFEEFWFAGARVITVYHIEMHRNGDVIDMPVVTNPYLRRMIRTSSMTVLPLEERDTVRREERDNGTHR